MKAEKFKNKSDVEKITSDWFCHEEARNKRDEIGRLILQSSEAARLEDRI